MSRPSPPVGEPREESANSSPSPRRRRLIFRLAAVGLGLFPFVLLEISLRAFDVGSSSEYIDPYVGFSELYPLFEKQEDRNVYATTQSRLTYFGQQEFAIEKPENGFRAFCLGGSTVHGRPFTTRTAFARWMQLELAANDPSRKYEIVNCGGLSYASYRLVHMLREVLKYEPDAVVIATGHNEFLEDRTYKNIKEQSAAQLWIGERMQSLRTVTAVRQLWKRMRGDDEDGNDQQQLSDKLLTRLDEESGYASYHRDPEWRKRVVEHYELSLQAMVVMCRKANVPLVFVRLGSNLRDCPPFKHEPAILESKADLKKEQEWRSAFAMASLLDKTKMKEALKLYHRAEELDGKHALMCYRIARIYDRMKDYDKARRYFLKAKDYDVCPLRILGSMTAIVEKVSKETKTPLLDARALLEENSPQKIPGSDFYLDHVHPTVEGHQIIGKAIVNLMRSEKIAFGEKSWTPKERRTAYRKYISKLGTGYFQEGTDRVIWLEGWARRKRMERETYPNTPRGMLHYGHRRADFGLESDAWREYKTLLKQDSGIALALSSRALSLYQQGRVKSALTLLNNLRSTVTGEALSETYFALLAIAMELDDQKAALEIYREHAEVISKVPAISVWRTTFPKLLEEIKKIVETS